MEKIKDKDILSVIYEYTHIKDEDGEPVPFYCFASDIINSLELDMTEEEVALVALNNGYKVFKAFAEETVLGGLILCAEGCAKEAIDKMYQEFYGEVPSIEEWPVKEEISEGADEGDLIPSEDVLPFKVEREHTLEEYMRLYGDLYNDGQLWDHDEDDLIAGWEEEDSTDFNAYDTFWLIDGRYYEVPKHSRVDEEMTKKEKEDALLKRVGVDGFNKPKRTPKHPTKSHVVVAKEGDNIKTIRFGEQGAETAGKPKKGESERMKAKRKSFKARHAKNIAKGKMSAAYWADKIKW